MSVTVLNSFSAHFERLSELQITKKLMLITKYGITDHEDKDMLVLQMFGYAGLTE